MWLNSKKTLKHDSYYPPLKVELTVEFLEEVTFSDGDENHLYNCFQTPAINAKSNRKLFLTNTKKNIFCWKENITEICLYLKHNKRKKQNIHNNLCSRVHRAHSEKFLNANLGFAFSITGLKASFLFYIKFYFQFMSISNEKTNFWPQCQFEFCFYTTENVKCLAL